MLEKLKEQANYTFTENGALAYWSTLSSCLDFFATAGALRNSNDREVLKRFHRAFCENPDFALRILFYARDIRQGLGERRLFRLIMVDLAATNPDTIIKNICNFAEYGRYDDLLVLLDTPCDEVLANYIKMKLEDDMNALKNGCSVSLLAKWLPSVNTSNPDTRNKAKQLCHLLKISQREYRKMLSALRVNIDILENRLREKDYSFEYEKQTSKALYKYRRAFYKNDWERYQMFLNQVQTGKVKLKTSSLYPYEIVRDAIEEAEKPSSTRENRNILDITWKSLENMAGAVNALAVIDGSGSMYAENSPRAIEIALSLGIYFAENNTGKFKNHFITFSNKPRLVEIKGRDIVDKVKYCMAYNEIVNTDLYEVFMLLLLTAYKNKLSQADLPDTLYIISDMEFDQGTVNDKTLFEDAKEKYEDYGYVLPAIVYWNVDARNEQLPVKKDDNGVVLVSGASPTVFKMAINNEITPFCLMLQVINSERYASITA